MLCAFDYMYLISVRGKFPYSCTRKSSHLHRSLSIEELYSDASPQDSRGIQIHRPLKKVLEKSAIWTAYELNGYGWTTVIIFKSHSESFNVPFYSIPKNHWSVETLSRIDASFNLSRRVETLGWSGLKWAARPRGGCTLWSCFFFRQGGLPSVGTSRSVPLGLPAWIYQAIQWVSLVDLPAQARAFRDIVLCAEHSTGGTGWLENWV